jgi:hypothetical protein
MAWNGFRASPFTMGRLFHSPSNFDTRHEEGRPGEDMTRAIDELLAEAGIYDGIEQHSVPSHGTDWQDHRDSFGATHCDQPELPE